MPFVRSSSSQHAHYDAVSSVISVRGKPFGILVCSEEAVELLEFSTQRWWPLPILEPSGRFGCAVASVKSSVYVVGGQHEMEPLQDCQSLEFGMTEWKQYENTMVVGRCYPAAIGSKNSLYVLGGRDKYWKCLNSVEVFDGQTWTTKSPMATPRMAPAVVVASTDKDKDEHDDNDDDPTTLIVIGGYTGDKWITSVEIWKDDNGDGYDSSSPRIPDLPIPLAFPKAVVVPKSTTNNNSNSSSSKNNNNKTNASWNFSKILVIGSTLLRPSGHASYMVMLSYNSSTNKWSKLASGATLRSRKSSAAFHALPSEGCAISLDTDSCTMYAVGGRDVKQNLPSSKHVLQWRFSPNSEESVLFKDLQSAMSTSPKRGSAGSGRRPVSGSVASGIPFSTIQLDDAGSEVGSVGIMSIASQRVRKNRNSSMNMLVQSYTTSNAPKKIPEGNKEDNESLGETTFVKDPMPWMDKQGIKGTYTGSVKRPPEPTEPHGKGRFESNVTGDYYDGEWRHGYRHGYGRWKFQSTGDVFEGWFVKDVKHGRGTYQWRDGRQFEGEYVQDLAQDPNGTLTWKNGTLFVGSFVNGQRTGMGTIRFPDNVKYTGEFRNGKYEGYGSCTFADGKIYTGHWKEGQAHGHGRLVERDGTMVHDGEWEHDAPILPSSGGAGADAAAF